MIKIKYISIFIFTILITGSCKNAHTKNRNFSSENVFSSLHYDKVIAYNYNGEGDNPIIDDAGHLAEKIKKKITLDKPQIIEITNLLCDKSTYGGDVAACFDPHFGIVFYNKNKVVAYISICLDCNYLVSSKEIPNSAGGFTDAGAQAIVDFEKEINY